MADDKWNQKGVTFRIATLEDFDIVKTFLEESFWPDEPVWRSCKLLEGILEKR